jgi:outer membrane protein assembly factor BamB
MRGDLLIMDAENGKINWSYELGSAVFGNPAVIDGYVIAGAQDGRIYCFGEK